MITSPKPTGEELWKAFVDAIWALLMPVIILGGIYGGYFTPTEAAAVAVVYGLIIGLFVYRELKWKDIPKTFVSYPILMNISLLFEHRHAGGATVAATALSLYSASGCLIGFFFGKIFYKLKRLTLVFGYFIAAAGAGILGFAKQTEILMIGSAIMGMTSVLLITSAYAILGMYISPNQSSLAIAIATGVSNLGGFASAYYLNMLGIITGEKLFTPIYVLMGVYTLLATAFMVYDPLRKNS